MPTKKAAPVKKAAAKAATKTAVKEAEKAASSPDLANELKKQEQLAQERVERREKMGQQARPEPALGDPVPETPDLPSVGSQLADAQNEESNTEEV
jgi:hypothetical protein